MPVMLAVLAAVTACASGRDANAACDPELDAALSAWADAGFSGSIALSTGEEFDCRAAFGDADQDSGTPNTTDTVFAIGSISKAFTATAIFDLIDAGELSLDDRAGGIVPGLGGPAADATIEQLLLHTSGLNGSHGADHQPLDHDEAVTAISGLEQEFEPGSDFLYSNAGYTLLALIVDEVSDSGYRDHMVSQILQLPNGDTAGGFWDGEPAASGPRATGYLDDGPSNERGDFEGPHWALSGNGDLAMTASDLASWTYALFSGDIVSPESVEAIGTPGFDHGDGMAEAPGWTVHDASLIGEPVLSTAGGGGDTGHNAAVFWLPESRRVTAIASNTPDIPAEDLLQAVGPALAAGEPPPTPEVSTVDVDPMELEALAGTYELTTGGSFDVTTGDDGLDITATGTDAVEALFPQPEGVSANDVETHEQAVLALLAGETEEGRNEIDALESDFGTIDDVDLIGTVYDGELRTYVTITFGSTSETLWYALNDRGGIEGVDGPATPSALFVPADGGLYRRQVPAGDGTDVTVEFDEEVMTVTGPEGSANAQLAY
jgi:CubicO group peptidase (beta-lactamase class C family)